MDFLEISNKNSKGGRRKIKMSLLEIHQDERATNKNGIHWKEKYVLNNLDSAKGMPICCEFLDKDKAVPFGHGLTGIDSKENQPLFENSECPGYIEIAYPMDTVIDGENKKILCGEGYIYAQRYPHFVEWLKENIAKGKIMSSIEITGKPENNNQIIYENDDVSADYRVPQVFDFTGTAILSIEPADDSAVVFQVNNFNKSDDNSGNTKESEEIEMDEKTLALITDSVKTAIVESNSKNAEYEAQIAALNEKLTEKENEISELNAKVTAATERADTAESSISELNSKIEALETQINECKKNEKRTELNSLMAGFSDEQKDFAKEEIEAFNADPMSVEINSIVDKIYLEIGKKAIEDIGKPVQRTSETNSIYGEVMDVIPAGNDDISLY